MVKKKYQKRKYPVWILVSTIGVIFLLGISLAHEDTAHEENHGENGDDHGKNGSLQIRDELLIQTFWALGIAGSLALGSVILALTFRSKKKLIKIILFCCISIPVTIATLYLTYTTVYLNIVSETGGPVHWHADYEVYVCDERQHLTGAKGLSNVVGEPLLHEHGDNRIHVEGVLLRKGHVNVANYFNAVGGFFNEFQFIFPTDKEVVNVKNGSTCPNGKKATIQAFVYQTHDKIMKQSKLNDPSHYILSGESNVPPGDCIIIEFDEEKQKTDHLCESYKIALQRGDLRGS